MSAFDNAACEGGRVTDQHLTDQTLKSGNSERLKPMKKSFLLGALVIVASWTLTWFYVRWANSHVDSQVAGISRSAP